MSGDYVERLRAAHALRAEHGVNDFTFDDDDVEAVLDELEQLRDKEDQIRHDAKRCTAVYHHQLYGPRRCELPAHKSSKHHAGLPGGWVKWSENIDGAEQLPERAPCCGGLHAGWIHAADCGSPQQPRHDSKPETRCPALSTTRLRLQCSRPEGHDAAHVAELDGMGRFSWNGD